jgi:hypothetical protein
VIFFPFHLSFPRYDCCPFVVFILHAFLATATALLAFGRFLFFAKRKIRFSLIQNLT